MRAISTLGIVVTVLALTLTACMGDDGDQKRAEAAKWCEVTLRLDGYLDDTDEFRAYGDQIDYDQASDWVDSAPASVRDATQRAASILRTNATGPRPPDLAEARKEIGAYAAEYCSAPARCIADVEGNPRLPCIREIEEARQP